MMVRGKKGKSPPFELSPWPAITILFLLELQLPVILNDKPKPPYCCLGWGSSASREAVGLRVGFSGRLRQKEKNMSLMSENVL